jgi:hypothetical protein
MDDKLAWRDFEESAVAYLLEESFKKVQLLTLLSLHYLRIEVIICFIFLYAVGPVLA